MLIEETFKNDLNTVIKSNLNEALSEGLKELYVHEPQSDLESSLKNKYNESCEDLALKVSNKIAEKLSGDLSKVITQYIKSQEITITVLPTEVTGASAMGPVTIQGIINPTNIMIQ